MFNFTSEPVKPRSVNVHTPKPYRLHWDWFRGQGIDKRVHGAEDVPEGAVGFVYEIHHKPSGKWYIGKKILKRKRTRPPLKGYKRKRVDYIDSDWLKYTGSNVEAKTWNPEDCERVIHHFCTRKDEMTFLETNLIFQRKALFTDEYLNDNVLGKFYQKTINEKFMKSK